MKLNFTKEDIAQSVRDLEKLGYAVNEKVLPIMFCDLLIEELNKIEEKKKRGINKGLINDADFNYRLSMGQLILRNLILKNPDLFLRTIDLEPVMEVVQSIMQETFILEDCIGSNSVLLAKNQSNYWAHIDSYIASDNINNTLDVVAILMLDDYTAINGAIKIWPQSHKTGIIVQKDSSIKDSTNLPGYKQLIAPKGSIAFILGQTWHQMGANIDGSSRWGILLHYTRWWIKPKTDFTKCGEECFRKLNLNQKVLLGFSSIPPKNREEKYKTLIEKDEIPNSYDEFLNI